MADGQSLLRWRLSLLMFLLYAPPGAVLPLLSLRLKELGFSPLEMGWVFAAQSLASLAAPLVAGQVADRWLAAERCVAICAVAGSGLLWLLAVLQSFAAVFAVSVVYWLVMVPALTLGTSLCFSHLSWPEGHFGRIRLWGTVGWVAPIWLLSGWFDNPYVVQWLLSWARPANPQPELADMFRLASLLSGWLGAYALTLPHTPPARQGGHWLAPLGALKLLRSRAFAVYTAITLGLCVTIPFSGQVTPLLLEHRGIARPWLCRTLTISQSMEIVALALLPMLLLRLGTAGTMRVGLAAWVAAMGLLVVGQPLGLVAAALTLNGLCVCCFLVAGQVFVNRHAQGDIRASVQGLLTFTNGLGLLTGNVLVGVVRGLVNEEFAPTFGVATGIALVLLAGFFAGFPSEEGNGVREG